MATRPVCRDVNDEGRVLVNSNQFENGPPGRLSNDAESVDGSGMTTDDRRTVVLVDDDDDLRCFARAALEIDSGFVVIGEGQNGWDAVRVVADCSPDVLLLDLEMPWLNGAEAVPILRRSSPRTVIVLWTVDPFGARAAEAMDLGASVTLDKFAVSPITLGRHLHRVLVVGDNVAAVTGHRSTKA